jgi:hypothetical protein
MTLLPRENESLTVMLNELSSFELGCIDVPPCFSLKRTDACRWQLSVNLINGLVASGLARVDLHGGLDHLPPDMIHDMCHFDPYQEIRHQTGPEWLSLCNLIPTEHLTALAQATGLHEDQEVNIAFVEAVLAHMAAKGVPLEKTIHPICPART